MDLAGKAALITGGGTGVGRATTLELAQQGCNVLVNYSRSADDAANTVKDAEAFGVKAIAHQADVSDDAQCRPMAEAATTAFGRLDILVNVAGICPRPTESNRVGRPPISSLIPLATCTRSSASSVYSSLYLPRRCPRRKHQPEQRTGRPTCTTTAAPGGPPPR